MHKLTAVFTLALFAGFACNTAPDAPSGGVDDHATPSEVARAQAEGRAMLGAGDTAAKAAADEIIKNTRAAESTMPGSGVETVRSALSWSCYAWMANALWWNWVFVIQGMKSAGVLHSEYECRQWVGGQESFLGGSCACDFVF
jgi:hypothetical protein